MIGMARRGVYLFALLLSLSLSCSFISGQDEPESNLPEDYSETGIASWYGPGFHSKQTASGELFNMYACTAAHKSLPLGITVRVSNLENGRETIVKINDRGPYVDGRIIDLSRAAARSVGIDDDNGMAKVKINIVSSFIKDYFRKKPIFLTLFAGTLGIAGMSLLLLLSTRSGFIKTDMIREIGSIYTKSYDSALLPGAAMHLAAGAVIALIYIAFVSPFFSCSIVSSIGMGAVTGLLCGIAVSSLLLVLIKKHYPIKHLHEFSFEVAAVYLIGCAVYGVILGVVAGIMHVKVL